MAVNINGDGVGVEEIENLGNILGMVDLPVQVAPGGFAETRNRVGYGGGCAVNPGQGMCGVGADGGNRGVGSCALDERNESREAVVGVGHQIPIRGWNEVRYLGELVGEMLYPRKGGFDAAPNCILGVDPNSEASARCIDAEHVVQVATAKSPGGGGVIGQAPWGENVGEDAREVGSGPAVHQGSLADDGGRNDAWAVL